MKGCAFFAALFLVGVGLVLAGFVYDAMSGELPVSKLALERHMQTVRVVQISGVAVAFAAIFGAAGWSFLTRARE